MNAKDEGLFKNCNLVGTHEGALIWRNYISHSWVQK